MLYKKKLMENIDEIIEEITGILSNKIFDPETSDAVYEGDVDVSSNK